MKTLSHLFLLLCAVAACGQAAKEKPAAAKPPAEEILGVWVQHLPAGDEYMTFSADGHAFMKTAQQMLTMTYKLDTTSTPWKLDMTDKYEGKDLVSYTIFSFPEPGKMRMASFAAEEGKRPAAEALAKGHSFEKLTLAANGGIHQVAEAHLKKLAGSWEGKDGRETVTLTFTTDGNYTMKVADYTDKGRFRIDVSKLPAGIDLLSSEGNAILYSIYQMTPDGDLQVGKAGRTAGERPVAFDDISTRTYKKQAAATKPK